MLNICILGTRGIPNNHGGFEQFAEFVSINLVRQGHSVTVYNSSTHPFQHKVWNGVDIIHCFDPEDKIGTAGQFIYDLNCILDSRKRNFDIILQLGYTSSSVWGWLLPRKKSVVTTNMDGLEWKRSKYSKKVQRFLKHAERWATVYSDYWVSDSIGIQAYLKEEYGKDSVYIPYGADTFENADPAVLRKYSVEAYSYDMLIARLEPENNIETILDGVKDSEKKRPFLVVGKYNTKYGNYLRDKYAGVKHIRFCDGIYDMNALNNLRYYSNLYFHGHSVGGTNPSLLEAMGSQAFICAHKNVFNAAILEEDALYFEDAEDISYHLDHSTRASLPNSVSNNLDKVRFKYSWESIGNQYLNHFNQILRK